MPWIGIAAACVMLWILAGAGSTPDGHAVLDDASVGEHIQSAMASRDWQPRQTTRSMGYQDHPLWLRWQVPDDHSEVLVVHNAWLDNFTVFFVADGRVISSHHTGGGLPVATRQTPHPDFVFTLPDDPRPTELYVRDSDSSSGALYPVSFLSWDGLLRYSGQLHVLHGIYYGIVLIMLVYNLMIFLSVRDRAYLYLVLYAGSLMVLFATSDGMGQFYVWPDSTSLQRVLAPLSLAALLIFLGQFCIHFLETASHTPVLTRLLRVLQITVGVNAIVVATTDSELSALLEPLSLFAATALLMSIGAIRAAQGDKAAPIFLAANGMMCIFGLTVAMTHLGWIDDSPIGRHGGLVGSALELALLSLALATRLRRQLRLQKLHKERSEVMTRRVRELRAAGSLAAEHRQLQRSMQHQQKLKTIGQMAGGIAHDFNNILATILGFAELALDKTALLDRDRQTRYLEEIRQAGERGAGLVRQLITFSRGEQKPATEIDLTHSVEEAATLLRGSLPATVTITTELPGQPLRTVLDPAQLQQVLVNLCLNASEAMMNRGTITLSLATRAVSSLQCSSCLKRFGGELAAITVTDTGGGIQSQAHELFTPFFTTKPVGQGSGLGLSVVHGIVHEHSGHVHFHNLREGGCTFTIYLPLNQRARTAEETGQRIMLIEDDPSVARYLETLLAKHDYSVTSVHLPTEALETFMAQPDSFDLVITDQLMPHGTGMELARDLLDLRPELPIIVTTGNPADIDPDEVQDTGVKAVFGKPIESELLLAKVRGLLAGLTT